MSEQKLVFGNVPANTRCPFADICVQESTCPAAAEEHGEFSCGLARLFDTGATEGILGDMIKEQTKPA